VEVDRVANDGIQREVLPIPDRRQIGLTTYDAKDPDTIYPRSRRSGPRRAHPMSWWS
jgi:hypothetical protein